jgi:nickel-dependent lactate racemase
MYHIEHEGYTITYVDGIENIYILLHEKVFSGLVELPEPTAFNYHDLGKAFLKPIAYPRLKEITNDKNNIVILILDSTRGVFSVEILCPAINA